MTNFKSTLTEYARRRLEVKFDVIFPSPDFFFDRPSSLYMILHRLPLPSL